MIMKAAKLKWFWGTVLIAAAGVYCAYLFLPHPSPKNVPRLAVGMDLFRNGQVKGNEAEMRKALRFSEDICQKEPGSYEAWHMKSVTEMHLMLLSLVQRDAESAEKYSMASEYSAMKVTALQSKFSEPYAVLAAVTALRPAKRGQAAAVRRYESLALMLGAENPRVHYLIGLRYYQGRGRLKNEDKSEQLFLMASELYEREPPGAKAFNFPSWGHDASLMHLGDIYRRQGDEQAAAGYYRRALAVNPFLESVRADLQTLKDAGPAADGQE